MATIKIKVDDHTKEVLEALGERSEVAMKAIGLECERYAKKDCPVDTGRLHNSITFATEHYQSPANADKRGAEDAKSSDYKQRGNPKEKSVYIGTNVEYAVYVEEGDRAHKVGKRHFLRDAATTHSDHYKAILEAALDGKNV